MVQNQCKQRQSFYRIDYKRNNLYFWQHPSILNIMDTILEKGKLKNFFQNDKQLLLKKVIRN